MAQGRRINPAGCAFVILFWPFILLWAMCATAWESVFGRKQPPVNITKAQVQDVAKAYREAKALIDARFKVLRDGKRVDNVEQGDSGLPQGTPEAGSQKENV